VSQTDSSNVILTLICHKKVNDLKTSPVDPLVIASASDDNSIRIWHLHPDVAHQPCAAVLSGDGGHETGVISLVKLILEPKLFILYLSIL